MPSQGKRKGKKIRIEMWISIGKVGKDLLASLLLLLMLWIGSMNGMELQLKSIQFNLINLQSERNFPRHPFAAHSLAAAASWRALN